MTNSNHQLDGIIDSVSSRQTRQKGLWTHRLIINGNEYSYLTHDSACLFHPGDMVRLKWRSRRGNWRTYRNIIGLPELARPHEDSARADGYIYILTNASMPGLVKIGMTTRTPEERCAELSRTSSVPKPFKVAMSYVIVGDVGLVESAVHARLSRSRSGKEFFRLTPEKASDAVLDVYFSLYPGQRGTPNIREARLKAYESDRAKAQAEQIVQDNDRQSKNETSRPILEAFEAAQAKLHSQQSAEDSSQIPEYSSAQHAWDVAVEVLGFIFSLVVLFGLIFLMRSCMLGQWF